MSSDCILFVCVLLGIYGLQDRQARMEISECYLFVSFEVLLPPTFGYEHLICSDVCAADYIDLI